MASVESMNEWRNLEIESEKGGSSRTRTGQVSYHYTNKENTTFEMRIDGETVAALGQLHDVKTRRGFVLIGKNGKGTLFPTMKALREYVQSTVKQVDGKWVSSLTK